MLLAVPDPPVGKGRPRRGLSRSGALLLALLVLARDAVPLPRTAPAPSLRSTAFIVRSAPPPAAGARERSL
ncbi:MAG TPA: hypothetical protein VLT33_03135 [Labilithrix sp.]|nr:hypothetical protein [Labilithrix sp.]